MKVGMYADVTLPLSRVSVTVFICDYTSKSQVSRWNPLLSSTCFLIVVWYFMGKIGLYKLLFSLHPYNHNVKSLLELINSGTCAYSPFFSLAFSRISPVLPLVHPPQRRYNKKNHSLKIALFSKLIF